MAAKTKLNASSFQRVGRGRNVEFKNIRVYYLIVCEGKKTEPDYFKALIKQLPQGVLQVCEFQVEGLGTNTTDLVEKARKMALEITAITGRPVDKIWCVFDKDSFSDQNFNAAIATCNQANDMEAAFSNEAFELWYLLHFNYLNTGMGREQYGVKLSECMTKAAGQRLKYAKNNPDNYLLMTTLGRQATAIENAKKLEQLYAGDTNYAKQNPRTSVHRLIEDIFDLEAK